MRDQDISHTIDRLCDDYEFAIRNNKQFDLPQTIKQLPIEHQPALIREIILLTREIATPDTFQTVVADIKINFPEHSEWIQNCQQIGNEPEFRQASGQSNTPTLVSLLQTREQPFSGIPEDLLSKTDHQSFHLSTNDNLKPECADDWITTQTIGNYELISILGYGGMGVVYLAKQEHPIKRQVALKIIKPGLNSQQVITRFEAEKNSLALMDHKNIAKVLDGGITRSGSPYFVMEWVKGMPINRYATENKLSLEQKLRIAIEICDGVEHAHQKGIIHRDLKPSNVLVTTEHGEAIPKIIDFGLAKATADSLNPLSFAQSEAGQILGTLQYMSPEQATLGSKDLDTRSDIYSLGILLYELITGSTPLNPDNTRGKSLIQIVQMIQGLEPEKPSRRVGSSYGTDSHPEPRSNRPVLRRIERELDWIILKCLAFDRERRYASARQLADDLRNFLENRPVIARPSTPYYRASKFIRRNLAYTVLIATLISTLIAATGASLFLAARADYAKRQSEVATKRALNTIQSIQELLLDSPVWKVNNPGRNALIDLLANEYVYWADETTVSKLDRPVIAENLVGLARNDVELGRIDRARRLAQTAIDLLGRNENANDPRSILLACSANILSMVGPYETPAALTPQVLQIEEILAGAPVDRLPLDLAILRCSTVQLLADTCFRYRNLRSFSLARKNLEECRYLLNQFPDHPELRLIQSMALSRIAICQHQSIGESDELLNPAFSEPIPLYNEAIQEAERLINENYRPAVTGKFLAGAISNRGLRLLRDATDGIASQQEVIENYETGVQICLQLLDKYPDNLTFIETHGLLLLNLASAHSSFLQRQTEAIIREQADEQLRRVKNEVGSLSTAAERYALNRIHFCANQLLLGQHEVANRLAWDFYQEERHEKPRIVERLAGEPFEKLVYYRLLLTQSNLFELDSFSEIELLQEQADTLFEFAVDNQLFLRNQRWPILTQTDLFTRYRDMPGYADFWAMPELSKAEITREQ